MSTISNQDVINIKVPVTEKVSYSSYFFSLALIQTILRFFQKNPMKYEFGNASRPCGNIDHALQMSCDRSYEIKAPAMHFGAIGFQRLWPGSDWLVRDPVNQWRKPLSCPTLLHDRIGLSECTLAHFAGQYSGHQIRKKISILY